MRRHHPIVPLVAVLLLVGCGSGATERTQPPRSTVSTVSTAGARHRADAVVDPALGPGRIEVAGTAEVGTRLVVHVSPDLEGRIDDWGWHRCIEIPTCRTIGGAEGPAYTPTAADAWQVLRVIAVAGGKGIEADVGPVVNPHPQPFREDYTLDPSVNENRSVIVGPGDVHVLADAPCPVSIVGGERPAGSRGTTEVLGFPSSAPATHVDTSTHGDGGELLVFVTGKCDRATLVVSGTR